MSTSRLRRIRAKMHPTEDALQREMRVIADLQRRLLPREVPKVAGWQVAAFSLTNDHPGGDYYDFFPLSGERLAFLVADASGHGTPSTVMVAQVRTFLHCCPLACGRSHAPFCPVSGTQTQPPHQILAHLDRLLERNCLEDYFMTAFYGVLNLKDGVLEYANAGHPVPRWWHAESNQVEPLPDVSGPPLGLGLAEGYPSGIVSLKPGDALLCFSDGLIEARNDGGEAFGLSRLDVFAEAAGSGAEAIQQRVLAAVDTFAGEAQLQDDITLLTVVRESSSAGR